MPRTAEEWAALDARIAARNAAAEGGWGSTWRATKNVGTALVGGALGLVGGGYVPGVRNLVRAGEEANAENIRNSGSSSGLYKTAMFTGSLAAAGVVGRGVGLALRGIRVLTVVSRAAGAAAVARKARAAAALPGASPALEGIALRAEREAAALKRLVEHLKNLKTMGNNKAARRAENMAFVDRESRMNTLSKTKAVEDLKLKVDGFAKAESDAAKKVATLKADIAKPPQKATPEQISAWKDELTKAREAHKKLTYVHNKDWVAARKQLDVATKEHADWVAGGPDLPPATAASGWRKGLKAAAGVAAPVGAGLIIANQGSPEPAAGESPESPALSEAEKQQAEREAWATQETPDVTTGLTGGKPAASTPRNTPVPSLSQEDYVATALKNAGLTGTTAQPAIRPGPAYVPDTLSDSYDNGSLAAMEARTRGTMQHKEAVLQQQADRLRQAKMDQVAGVGRRNAWAQAETARLDARDAESRGLIERQQVQQVAVVEAAQDRYQALQLAALNNSSLEKRTALAGIQGSQNREYQRLVAAEIMRQKFSNEQGKIALQAQNATHLREKQNEVAAYNKTIQPGLEETSKQKTAREAKWKAIDERQQREREILKSQIAPPIYQADPEAALNVQSTAVAEPEATYDPNALTRDATAQVLSPDGYDLQEPQYA